MSTAIALLTYRRAQSLRTFLTSIREHCPGYPMAIFEDMGNSDDTAQWLTQSAKFHGVDAELAADRWDGFDYTAFIGNRNLGVSGNSNRAIRWFMRDTTCDHLCLCNDDLEARGDFTKVYADAHKASNIGLFCFSDWDDEDHKPVVIRDRGRVYHLLTRRKGIMMSITRKLVERIGYFDAEMFSKFGNEHNDYTNRAAQAGFMSIKGQPQHCIDVPCPALAHQDVPSSINLAEKPKLDAEADRAMEIVANQYPFVDPYRDFSLGGYGMWVGAYANSGIHVATLRRLMNYGLIEDYVPDLA